MSPQLAREISLNYLAGVFPEHFEAPFKAPFKATTEATSHGH